MNHFLQVESVKLESHVIGDHNASVNLYLGFAHTARHVKRAWDE